MSVNFQGMNPQVQVQKPVAFKGQPQAAQINMAPKADVVAFQGVEKVATEAVKSGGVKQLLTKAVQNIGKLGTMALNGIKALGKLIMAPIKALMNLVKGAPKPPVA